MKIAVKLAAGVLVAGAAAFLPASPAQAAPGNCTAGFVTPSVVTSWAICTSGSGQYVAVAKCTDGITYTGPSWKSVGQGYSYASCPSGTRITAAGYFAG
ncbi:hypothetical protein [Cryptosporangium japonicum]|uniref:Secreted protein n=1 Tax=Cryptosporangium japonicum TaxID=80872 RepID=A0ABN0U8K4_9ACTN